MSLGIFRRNRQDPADRDEAAGLVAAEIERLRQLSYEELLAANNTSRHDDLVLASGTAVVRETQILRDSRQGEALRVIVDVSSRDAPNPALAIGDFVRTETGVVGD